MATLANGMMVRYSDFVDMIGGDEQQLGLIVGVGMIGSIIIRVAQGEAIDRIGSARVWFWSVVVYTFSLLLHLSISSATSPGVFLVRALMQASLAGFFGASITFVSLRVPAKRMAEIVGALGTSGFLGLMIGPLISDWLGSGNLSKEEMVLRMFWTAAALALTSAIATWFAIQGAVLPARHARPSLLSVIRQYHPLMISVTAAVMGAGFAIPATFLRPFAIEARISHVGVFFVIYAMTGFGATTGLAIIVRALWQSAVDCGRPDLVVDQLSMLRAGHEDVALACPRCTGRDGSRVIVSFDYVGRNRGVSSSLSGCCHVVDSGDV
jgi:MFS family permease